MAQAPQTFRDASTAYKWIIDDVCARVSQEFRVNSVDE
jgi:hypothetical protein